MERSSAATEEEVEVTEKKAIFYVYHPCYFLEQFFRALFRCLGFTEIRANEDSKRLNALSDVAENSGSSNTVSYQDDDVPSTTAEEAVDPPSTTPNQQIITSALTRRRPRRSGLSTGSGPQTN